MIGYVHFVTFFVVLIIFETVFRIIRSKEDTFKDPDREVTYEEFRARIDRGEELVILDDLILDVSRFRYNHPGGNFLIHQNIGRDISKFFYGGYILENY